jgi:hypothetical protein
VRGYVVGDDVREGIRECIKHAEDCARRAAAQSDPGLRKDFLDLEKHWLALARSMELTEQIGNIVKPPRLPSVEGATGR